MTNQSASPLNVVNLMICLVALLFVLLLLLISVRIVQIEQLSARQPTGDHDVDGSRHGGLASAIVRSLPAMRVGEESEKGGVHGRTECAVCLGEFFAGEWLRLLPKCAHAFHVTCIDTWLRTHSNCPLCRCSLLEQGTLQDQEFVSEGTGECMFDTDFGISDPGTIISGNRYSTERC